MLIWGKSISVNTPEMNENVHEQALCKGSDRYMRANIGPTVLPEGCSRSSQVSITSLMSSSVQTWLTFTTKLKFERLISNGIEFIENSDNTPDCSQVRPSKLFLYFSKKYYSCTQSLIRRKIWEKRIKISWNHIWIHENALMAGVSQKLGLVGKGGSFSPFKS